MITFDEMSVLAREPKRTDKLKLTRAEKLQIANDFLRDHVEPRHPERRVRKMRR